LAWFLKEQVCANDYGLQQAVANLTFSIDIGTSEAAKA